MNENIAQRIIEAKPIQRRPHLSMNIAKTMAAGNSVRAAKENDTKTFEFNNFMFQTWPSNTRIIINLNTNYSVNRNVQFNIGK